MLYNKNRWNLIHANQLSFSAKNLERKKKLIRKAKADAAAAAAERERLARVVSKAVEEEVDYRIPIKVHTPAGDIVKFTLEPDTMISDLLRMVRFYLRKKGLEYDDSWVLFVWEGKQLEFGSLEYHKVPPGAEFHYRGRSTFLTFRKKKIPPPPKPPKPQPPPPIMIAGFEFNELMRRPTLMTPVMRLKLDRYFWNYTQNPVLSSIEPITGSVWGGTRVTLRGMGFGSNNSATIVLMDGVEAQDVMLLSDREISFVTPPARRGAKGGGWVSVVLRVQNEESKQFFRFLYDGPVVERLHPHRGLEEGGTLVTIDGTGFGQDAKNVNVTIGGVPCPKVEIVKPGVKVVATTPPGKGVMLPVVVTVIKPRAEQGKHILSSIETAETKFEYGLTFEEFDLFVDVLDRSSYLEKPKVKVNVRSPFVFDCNDLLKNSQNPAKEENDIVRMIEENRVTFTNMYFYYASFRSSSGEDATYEMSARQFHTALEDMRVIGSAMIGGPVDFPTLSAIIRRSNRNQNLSGEVRFKYSEFCNAIIRVAAMKCYSEFFYVQNELGEKRLPAMVKNMLERRNLKKLVAGAVIAGSMPLAERVKLFLTQHVEKKACVLASQRHFLSIYLARPIQEILFQRKPLLESIFSIYSTSIGEMLWPGALSFANEMHMIDVVNFRRGILEKTFRTHHIQKLQSLQEEDWTARFMKRLEDQYDSMADMTIYQREDTNIDRDSDTDEDEMLAIYESVLNSDFDIPNHDLYGRVLEDGHVLSSMIVEGMDDAVDRTVQRISASYDDDVYFNEGGEAGEAVGDFADESGVAELLSNAEAEVVESSFNDGETEIVDDTEELMKGMSPVERASFKISMGEEVVEVKDHGETRMVKPHKLKLNPAQIRAAFTLTNMGYWADGDTIGCKHETLCRGDTAVCPEPEKLLQTKLAMGYEEFQEFIVRLLCMDAGWDFTSKKHLTVERVAVRLEAVIVAMALLSEGSRMTVQEAASQLNMFTSSSLVMGGSPMSMIAAASKRSPSMPEAASPSPDNIPDIDPYPDQ